MPLGFTDLAKNCAVIATVAANRVLALDHDERTVWIVDAHRDDGKRFVVRADQILTAFLELEAAIREAGKMRYREPLRIKTR